MARDLDLFFFPGSTYTFLTALRVQQAAADRGVTIRWHPFNVRAIMIEMDNIPFAKKPIKAEYMWRDIERRAKRHGLRWGGRPPYPVDPDLKALKIAAVAAADGFCAEFVEASYRDWFLEGRAPGVGDNTENVISALGYDPVRMLTRANSQEVLHQLHAETDTARKLGIFGSPTFAVGEEIFWGDDRLEDALDWIDEGG